MIYTKRILSLLLLIIVSQNFRIITDKDSLSTEMLKEIDNITQFISNNSQKAINIFPYWVYPYKVYHHQTSQSVHSLTEGYLFAKIPFTNIADLFQIPNITEFDQDEKQILYDLLPDFAFVEPDLHEQISLELLDNSFNSQIFSIKSLNSSDSEQTTTLHFYSLQTHSYLYEVTRKAIQKLRVESIQEKLEQLFLGQNPDDSLAPHHNQTEVRDRLIIYTILSNETIMQHYQPINKLICSYHNTTLRSNSRWKAIFDGIHLRYFSATISSISSTDKSKLQLVSLTFRAGQVKSNITISQPINYFNLKDIAQLDICSWQSTHRLLISDGFNIYAIEIGGTDWHLIKHIKNNTASPVLTDVFLGYGCKIFEVYSQQIISELEQNNTTTQVVAKFTHIEEAFNQYPKKRLTIRKEMVFFKALRHKYALLCWQDKKCSLYDTSHFNQLLLFEILEMQQLKVGIRRSFKNMTILQNLQIQVQKQLLLFELDVQLFSQNTSSMAPIILYDIQTYLNHTAFIGRQMNRVVIEHIQNTQYVPKNSVSQLYNQIEGFTQGDQQFCHIEQYPTSSIIELSYNQTSPWIGCVFDVQSSVYLRLRLSFSDIYGISYKIYLCSYQSNDNPYFFVDCKSLVETSRLNSPQIIQSLHGSYYYKVYVVKHNSLGATKNLPNIFIQDIQKQQIQIASTIFFYIMLTLTLLLVGTIIIIILRNVLASVLIYYGYMEDRIEPTYPLPWFAYRTKIKRLQQIGVLKYIKYKTQFLSTDQGNQCCFCLDLLKTHSTVARLYCSHEFHKDCFNQWIKNQPNTRCPTCRRAFTQGAVEQYHGATGSNQQLPI